MSLIDKLKARRRKKRKTGKRMRHFKENGAWSRFRRARARHRAQVKAIKKLKKAIAEHKESDWPESMVIEELFNNDNGLHNHVHIASQERDKLIQLGNICLAKYSGGDPYCVREFSPFDPVDPVHSPTSWHYRDLAFDLRSSPRQAFADEVKRRYYVKECDF